MEYPDYLTPTRERLKLTGKPYVIENVNGSPLNGVLMLCGTMFGLKIIKHRFFEFNWDMPINAPFTCNHKDIYNPWQGKDRSAKKMRDAMGIDWMPTAGGASRKAGYTGDLYNAIPPAYTKYIGEYLLRRLGDCADVLQSEDNAMLAQLEGEAEAEACAKWEAEEAERITRDRY